MISNQKELFELLLRLSRARAECEDFYTSPWDSKHEIIQDIWNDLTSPANLAVVKLWASDAKDMNPVAKALALKALEVCTDRFSKR
jgi:hypothetical protein